MSSIKFIATYARVSTSAQEEQETIKTQTETLKDFAAKNGYTIVKEYTDEGWSGDSLVRPSLDRLRADVKSKQWDAVLIYDPDRLARRYSYQELLMDEFKEAGIDVLFVTISSPKNNEDKILYGVRGLFAEYERTKIAERFRLGKIRNVKEGNIITSEAPYGYDYVHRKDKTPGYIKINPIEARVVKMIFKWIGEEAYTQKKIITSLYTMGIKPRKSKRGVWSTSTLSTLLRNKTYIGEAHWGSTYCVVPVNPTSKEKYRKVKKSSRRFRPESEWYKIPVPAIISPQLFEAAKVQLEANSLHSKRNTKNPYLLTGKIYCECGRRRIGERVKKGKHVYYRCTDRILRHPLPSQCKLKSINAIETDIFVWNAIKELMCSTTLLMQQAELWKAGKEKIPNVTKSEITSLETGLQKLKTEEDRFTKAYGLGFITIEKLGEYVTPIRDKINGFEMQLNKLKETISTQKTFLLPQAEEIEDFVQSIRDKLDNLSFEVKKAIMIQVINKVVVAKGQLQISGFIPINNHVGFISSYRNSMSANQHSEESPYQVPFEFEIPVPKTLVRGVDYGFGSKICK